MTNQRAQEIALEAQEARRQHTEADGYVELLGPWLETPYSPDPMDPDTKVFHDKITTTKVWNKLLGMNGVPSRPIQQELAKALKKLGWEHRRHWIPPNTTIYHFHRPETDGSELL